MGFTLTEGHFSTREEALAEIEARGWHAVFGFNVDPATMTQPVNKPVGELA